MTERKHLQRDDASPDDTQLQPSCCPGASSEPPPVCSGNGWSANTLKKFPEYLMRREWPPKLLSESLQQEDYFSTDMNSRSKTPTCKEEVKAATADVSKRAEK